MRFTREVRRVLTATILLALSSAPALATNGMYLAGYGSEPAGRGGANLAVADHALGLQANPAGIEHIRGRELCIDAQFLAPSLKYDGDPFGNAMDGKSKLFAMPAISYVKGYPESPWSWGIALISQGGMGATFENYATPFGTTDKTTSEVRFATLTPTVAYRANDQFSFGVSVNAGYSDVTFGFWPGTSYYNDGGTPADPTDDVGFFGADLSTRAKAYTTSVRGGALWHANPMFTFGAIYQTETSGDYKHGTLTLNETAIGLDKVQYDATVEGFTWPAQYGAGVEVRPAKGWMFAADVRRYLWNHAMNRITVKGENPSVASPVTNPVMPFVFNWDDQWVTSLGTEYAVNEAVTLRAGWNYGKSPVPDATLNPLFPATTVNHASGGLSWKRDGHMVNLALERAFNAEQVNLNTSPNVNPFGPGMCVEHSQWTFSLGYGRAF
jgi:long-chain fatty acid transport protein